MNWIDSNLENLPVRKSWRNIFNDAFNEPKIKNNLKQLSEKIKTEVDCNVYPPRNMVFNAFNSCSFKKIKVVIIGQDSYHGFDQATGLAFSVSNTQKIPPSLRNIFKELIRDPDVDFQKPFNNGDLSHWSKQGILLMNCGLTVKEGKAGSHLKYWEPFTDFIIKRISEDISDRKIVFVGWGKYAQNKINSFVDAKKHHCLFSPHPSPLTTGFIGNGHFSQIQKLINQKLIF